MAIYVPPSTRRRRLVLLVAAGLVVGLLLGFAVGRGTAEGIDDAVDAAKDQAEDAAVALQRIPIEYEQATAGAGGESTDTITRALASARDALHAAFDDATWFGPRPREEVDAEIDRLEAAVEARVAPEEFEAEVDAAVAAIEAIFGVDAAGAG
jgi:hypothetical protein